MKESKTASWYSLLPQQPSGFNVQRSSVKLGQNKCIPAVEFQQLGRFLYIEIAAEWHEMRWMIHHILAFHQ